MNLDEQDKQFLKTFREFLKINRTVFNRLTPKYFPNEEDAPEYWQDIDGATGTVIESIDEVLSND